MRHLGIGKKTGTMWRIKFIAVTGVLVGAMMAGLMVASASWSWNAEFDVEGRETHVTWSVIDDLGGSENYHANIELKLPEQAEASIVSEAISEMASISYTDSLSCIKKDIESSATVEVNPLAGAIGNQVLVTVTTAKNKSHSEILAQEIGTLGEEIELSFLIRAKGPGCGK